MAISNLCRLSGVVFCSTLTLSFAWSEGVELDQNSVSSPAGWIREQGTDERLFDFYEDFKKTEDGNILKSNRFIELATKEDSLREKLLMDADKKRVLVYEVEQLQIDEKGTLRFDYENKELHFKYYKNKKWKENTEKIEEPHVIGAMIPQLITNNLEMLNAGKRLRFKLAVPYMTKSFDFNIDKSDTVEFEGRTMVVFRMSPSHVLVSAVVRPLFFTFDLESKELRKIEGRHFLKKRVKSSWDAFQGETLFLNP